ncbi:MAG: hypothetical protein NVS1B10_06020 [Candidatus Saccharimonadales bacterium]
MKHQKIKEVIVDTMRDMHDNGSDWLAPLDIAQQVTARDEKFMKGYRVGQKVLSLVNLKLPEKPINLIVATMIPVVTSELIAEGSARSISNFNGPITSGVDKRLYQLNQTPEQLLN